ncbi:MAG: YIP1 family protein [Chitinophagaceae bacterium]
MENLLDDFYEVQSFTDKEIFTKIWISPRPIFKYINHFKYQKYLTILLILAGIANAFDRAERKNLLSGDSIVISIIGSIIGGALFGWISYYLYSSLIRFTGKWINGNADTDSILRVLAYASSPSIAGLVLIIPKLLLYNTDLYENILTYGFSIVESILGIWTLVLYVVGISEVQQFSIGKAIINLILPALIIFIPLLLLIYLFTGFH